MRRLAATIALIAILMPQLPAAAAGTSVFSFSAASTIVSVGDTFSVPVTVVPGQASINVARMVLQFPAALLRINSFTHSPDFPFLSPPGMTIDNTNGYFNAGGYILNDSHAVPTLFGTLSVTALAPGTATISIQPGSHLISPSQVEELSLTTPQQITFTIGTPPPPANRPPSFSAIGTQQVTVGNTVSFGLQATDPDGDLVSIVAGPMPTGATFTGGAPAASSTGAFSWTPAAAGTYSATFTATDNDSDPRSAVITITIQVNTPANTAPSFVSIPVQSITLGQTVAFSVRATDSDTVLLSWTIPTGASVSGITNNAPIVQAAFSWTPTAQGVYYAVFSAADDSPYGAQTATLTVPIYVGIPANTAPVIDPIAEVVANAGEQITISVHAHDTEPVILSATIPDGATFASPAPAPDVIGGLTWTPQVNGIYAVVFTAQDTNQFNPAAASRTVRITVFGGTCPSIDQASCSVLASQTCELPAADRLTCDGAAGDVEPMVQNTAAPRVYSLTHPDTAVWYAKNNPEIGWELPAAAVGAAVSIDQSPDAFPGTGVTPAGTTRYGMTRVADGVWYAHVRAKFSYGWSPVAHYPLRIDTQAPSILPPTIEQTAENAMNRSYRVAVSAIDRHSGIATYEYAVDAGDWRTVSFPYLLTADESRGSTFRIRVTDRAGNAALTAFDLREAVTRARVAVPYVAVTPLQPPVVHPHYVVTTVGLFVRKAALVFTGTAAPYTDIATHIDDHLGAARTDRSGDWIYPHFSNLPAGTYTLWADAHRDGVTSAPSNSIAVVLDRDFVARTAIAWWRILLLLFILLLLILLLLWLWRRRNDQDDDQRTDKTYARR